MQTPQKALKAPPLVVSPMSQPCLIPLHPAYPLHHHHHPISISCLPCEPPALSSLLLVFATPNLPTDQWPPEIPFTQFPVNKKRNSKTTRKTEMGNQIKSNNTLSVALERGGGNRRLQRRNLTTMLMLQAAGSCHGERGGGFQLTVSGSRYVKRPTTPRREVYMAG